MFRFLLFLSKSAAGSPLMIFASVMLGAGAMTRIQNSIIEAFWWFIPCLAIIFADLLSAKNNAKKDGIKWRWTTAARRTINKIVCYLCWIIFCIALNHQYDTELVAFIGMAFVFVVEGSSFVNNRLNALGYHLNFQNILNVFGKKKGIDDLGSIIDKKEEKK